MGKNTGERAILREEKRLAKEKKRQIETANKMLIPVSKKTNQSLGIQSFEPEGTIRLQNNRWLRVFEATEDTLCQMVGASNKLNGGMRITMHMSDESGRATCHISLKLYHTGAKKMMQNKHYLGDDYYPAIIDNETFVAAEAERVKRQAKLGRVFADKPAKVSKIATGFKMPKVQIKYDDPFTQAEYVYSLIESEVDV